jgi:hypothetical protein
MLTNAKHGELEATLTRSFIAESNMRRWIERPHGNPELQELQKIFDETMSPSTRGTVATEDASLNALFGPDAQRELITPLNSSPEGDMEVDVDVELQNDPMDVDMEATEQDSQSVQHMYRAVSTATPADLARACPDLQSQVMLQNKIRMHGVVYSTLTSHLGGSNVLYFKAKAAEDKTEAVAGRISYIYTHKDRTLLAVTRCVPMPSNYVDSFARYSGFPAKVYSSTFNANLEIIRPEDLKCHTARYPLDASKVVIVSLSRND